MSYMERLKARIAEKPISDELPKLPKPGSDSFGSGPDRHISENAAAVAFLPPLIAAGLDRLRTMRCPRIQRPELWAEIVRDGLRIATDGWASQALSLGWNALALWGVEPSAEPDTWDHSLAVSMEGWPIVDVTANFITLRRGNASRPFRNRARPSLSQFLWELG